MTEESLALSVLIGAILPPVFSVVLQAKWSDKAKSIISLALCLAVAAATSFIVDGVDIEDPDFNWVIWAAGIYGSAMITYGKFWKPTGVSPAIEAKTSV